MRARSTLRRMLCAALALGAALAFAAPAGAATDDDPKLPVTVQVGSITPSILRPGEDLTVVATLTNTGTEVIERPTAILRLSRFNVSTRDGLEDWTSSDTCTSRAPCPTVATVVLPAPLGVGQSVPVELTVPASKVRLLDLPDVWGPRGLSVELLDNRTRVGIERTFLLWMTTDAEVARTPVSVLVPVTGPGADPLTPQSTDLDPLVAPGGRLDELRSTLATNPDIGVAVDPALLASAALGSSRAQTWADSLDADLTHHDVLSLPWSDPDVGAAARAQQVPLVQLAVDGSATAGLDGPGILWAPSAAFDQTTAAVTEQVHQPAIVAEPGTVDLDDPKDGTTPPARTVVRTPAGSVHALVPDGRLSALLTDPTVHDQQATPATTSQRALAELAVVSRETASDQPHLLLTAGRSWTPDRATVTALLDALDGAPWVDLTKASTLLDTDEAAGKGSVPASADDPEALAVDLVRALATARDQAVAFATVTSEPDELLDGVDAEVVAPLAVAWRADPARRADLVNRVLTDLGARTTGLSIGEVSDVNVISSTGDIPIKVINDLSVPVDVALNVDPAKSCLEAEDVPSVVIAAKSEQIVPVALHARANCDVAVVASLATTDGTPVAAPVAFTARVAPTIESVGTIVVGALLAVGLVLGIVRTIRRGQSGRRGARIDAEKVPPLPVLGGSEDKS